MIRKLLVFVWVAILISGIYLVKMNKEIKQSGKNNTNRVDSYRDCSKKDFYNIAPEFKRILSLIDQRMGDTGLSSCLDISYGDVTKTSGAEGVFLFDISQASVDRLPIFVDRSYKDADDLVTAILLVHEIKHARQFIDVLNGVDKLSCLDKEVEAFLTQLAFMTKLNNEEIKSVAARMNFENWGLNPQLALVKKFLILSRKYDSTCDGDGKCMAQKLINDVSSSVYNDPGYKKQCGGD